MGSGFPSTWRRKPRCVLVSVSSCCPVQSLGDGRWMMEKERTREKRADVSAESVTLGWRHSGPRRTPECDLRVFADVTVKGSWGRGSQCVWCPWRKVAWRCRGEDCGDRCRQRGRASVWQGTPRIAQIPPETQRGRNHPPAELPEGTLCNDTLTLGL